MRSIFTSALALLFGLSLVAGANALQTVGAGGAGAPAYLLVVDEKPNGSDGGSATAGNWHTRDLNTVKVNEIAGASLAANRLTLPAGTWRIRARAPAWQVNRHILRLRNITDGTTILHGENCHSQDTDATAVRCELVGQFTLAAQKALELQHYTQSAKNSYGLGYGLAGQASPAPETYAVVEIWKVD